MTSVTVRPITSEETHRFVSIGVDSSYADDVQHYLEQMFSIGSMRPEWCFYAEQAAQLRGRVAFWTLPTLDKPLDMVLLELPWESPEYLSFGTAMLQLVLDQMRSRGVTSIGYVLDDPPLAPQWQKHPAKRKALLQAMGFKQERVTHRFEWKMRGAPLRESDELVFRSFPEVGTPVFLDAIRLVSRGTLDSRIRSDCQARGDWEQAKSLLEDLQQMKYDPSWWQLAYTRQGDLVGLVMPTESPTFATIGYIGVVPRYRGRGYIHLLLNRGTNILLSNGVTLIRTDTDVNNIPMANAFKKAGYMPFATREEYRLEI
ncbi:GNAT family N-acetyltransferase [Brevibacillus humidisoli]|uniref:GNAT family N-acetyltransferase n=1 Tax=Brevibacillus humidisoli TaxID=2895522 RepID=UPI001E51DD28|nr:GNAT family N-acetyltransferase [Brevibacillus humidisoli]UFJ39904.1 GNAT family N-acetyltransferase [Brevibacillus humidisoli]